MWMKQSSLDTKGIFGLGISFFNTSKYFGVTQVSSTFMEYLDQQSDDK